MIVFKFGGTSVGTPDRIRAVAHLVASQPGRKTLVLSAMSGTTNDLVELSRLIVIGERNQATRLVDRLRSKYLDNTVPELFAGAVEYQERAEEILSPILDQLLVQTLNEAFTHNDEKMILSRGEMMSTALMALTLELYEGVTPHKLSALDFMRINHDGRPDIEYIATHLHPLIDPIEDREALFLTEGYICTNAFGEIDNLRRGGSDYSATLIGEAIRADEIQIWTDIDGLHNNDPRVVNVTSPVRKLSFGEAAELARFGAKILHPACIEPAKRGGIPVRLLNTLDPKAPGTLISHDTNRDMIKAVSAKDGMCVVTLTLRHLSNSNTSSSEFLMSISQAMHELHIEPDIMQVSGDGYVLVTEENPDAIRQFSDRLSPWADCEVQSEVSIVAIVGDMGWHRIGFESRVLHAIDDIAIRLISYGTSSNSIDLVISTEEKKRAMIYLSDHLFSHLRTPGPEIL